MPFANSKYIPLQDKTGRVFTWWIIDNSEPWMIPYKNTPYARNFRVNWRWISIAPGFTQVWTNLGTIQTYPKWLSAYYRSNPANDSVIVNYPYDSTHKLIAVNPTDYTQTLIDTWANITSTNRMNFLSANDSLYCMNWVDELGKLNWTTYTKPTLWITLKPSFAAFFDNSMFVSWDATSPNSLYKSSENNPESFTWTWSDLFTASYPIVWLASAAQTLYIFSESTIDMINNNSIKQIGNSLVYTSLPLEASEWAMNHNTIGVFGRDSYFLSKSGKIKKVMPNGMLHYDVIELSHRANKGINKTMETLDADQSAWFCYVIPERQIIKWHLKTKWSNYNDICIIYNTEYDEFMVDDHKIFYGGINYKTKNFTISHIEPKLYRDEYGQSNDDSPIQFVYDTKHIDLGQPTMLKELWQTRTFLGVNWLANPIQQIYAEWNLVDSRTLTSADIPIDIDWIWTEEVGTFRIWAENITQNDLYNITLVREKWNLQVRAKYFKFRYTNTSLWWQILLQNLQPSMEMLSQLTTSTIN